MADNPPASNPGSLPPLPSSGMTGRIKSPTTHLPVKKGGAGKIVVLLSSVAKPPPNTQLIPRLPAQAAAPAAPAPPTDKPATPSTPEAARPTPLPPKQVAPAKSIPAPPKLSTTTYVKLPPKTTVPGWSSLSGKPVAAPVPVETPVPTVNAVPPPKVTEQVKSEMKKPGIQLIPPIKLNEPTARDESGESIFLQRKAPEPAAPKTEIAKDPTPAPAASASPSVTTGSPQSLEAFERSQVETPKPAPAPIIEAKEKPAPIVAPPLIPPLPSPASKAVTGTVTPVRPPPLPPPVAKVAEPAPAPVPILHVAPPMLEKAPELPPEKLAQPHFSHDTRKSETPEITPESTAVHKVPALIQPDLPPAKPLLSQPTVASKMGSWMRKTAPLVVSSSSTKMEPPKIAEAKPALKPPVLPSRSLLVPAIVDTPRPSAEAVPPLVEPITAKDKVEDKAPESAPAMTKPPELPVSVPMAGLAAAVPVITETTPAKSIPPLPTPSNPIVPKEKVPLPLTRVARAKKRRLWGAVAFWALVFPAALLVLFFGSLHFGRDTRIEGEVIPPPGMTLSNEVWIVSDFRELASGIGEDLAEERTPMLQEIQEKQDHVQRAQADVAAREERIRLIQDEIDASKAEIDTLVKQSRDATQKVWDVDGAEIDSEYTSRFNELQRTIADRAKSLKLNYQTDPDFESPEVWANAYRLALYQVPAGVDTVKEHQWLGDLMTQWRAYLKTLDDRKEQLREKAAQIKLAPASRITDLNAKIEDLGQRSDATETEEVPLKAELQQAQLDLAQTQAAEAGLDDKYYKQLEVLPEESIVNHLRFPLATNGRFTWVDDDVFGEGEVEHHYWIFALAMRPDGRQYWVLGHFGIQKDHKVCLLIEPDSFVSTKAILRPDLSPDEQAQ